MIRITSLFLTLFLMGCEADRNAALITHITFDEVDGRKAKDVSGRGHHAVSERLALGNGVHGKALSLDGTAASVLELRDVGDLISAADDITISLWAYRENEGNTALTVHNYPAMFLGFHGPQFKWQLRYGNGRGASCYADRTYEAKLNRWYHIAATFDGWRARLFVDGVEICSDWTRGGAIDIVDKPARLGGYEDPEKGLIDLMRGRLDDVRIYDAALSASQIEALAALPSR